MTPKKKRFYILFSIFSFFCFIIGVILIVLQDNILFFYTPSEILQKNLKQNEKVRLGGLVEENSIIRNDIKINIGSIKKNMEICNLKLMINSIKAKNLDLILFFIGYTNVKYHYVKIQSNNIATRNFFI